MYACMYVRATRVTFKKTILHPFAKTMPIFNRNGTIFSINQNRRQKYCFFRHFNIAPVYWQQKNLPHANSSHPVYIRFEMLRVSNSDCIFNIVVDCADLRFPNSTVGVPWLQQKVGLLETVQKHCLVWMSLVTYKSRGYIYAYCCVLFTSMARVRIRFSVPFAGGYEKIIYTNFRTRSTPA